MFVNASNNAVAKLSSNINSSQTTLTVDDASIFPDAPFLITVNEEIMRVASVSGNSLTVQRGREGTSASSHNVGSNVENNFTAGTYQALVDEVKALKQQSGIVEMGENENGTFEKYGNGLMICRKGFRTSVNNSIGNIYRSDAMVWDYPHIFIDDNVSVNFNCRAVNRWADTTGSIDNISAPFRVYSATSSSGEYLVNATAIGRWK